MNLHIILLVSYSFGIETIIRSYTPVVSLKKKPDSRPIGLSLYPFSDQNAAKTLPFGAAHTCMAYIREYLPGCSRGLVVDTIFCLPVDGPITEGIYKLEGIQALVYGIPSLK